MNMNQKMALLAGGTILFLSLSGCGCQHEWQKATCTAAKTCTKCGETEGEALGHQWAEATCTAPKTCSVCSETEGEALGHQWTEATCTAPKTCSVCNTTEGEALGHNVLQWQETAAATCAQEGSRTGICDRCKETMTESIAKLAHTPGDWQITEAATISKLGTKERYCTVCGARTDFELYEYEISLSELAALAENSISLNYPHYTTSSDESTATVTLNIWFDGLAADITSLKLLGGDANSEIWVKAKASTVNMAKTVQNAFKGVGRPDVHLVVNVLNDLDMSRIFLSILDGTIIYDCLA